MSMRDGTRSSIMAEIRKGQMLRCPISGIYVNESRMIRDNLGRLVFKKAIRYVNTWTTDLQMKPGKSFDNVVTAQPGIGEDTGPIITFHSGEELTWQ